MPLSNLIPSPIRQPLRKLRDYIVSLLSDTLNFEDDTRMGINHEAGQIYFCTKK